MRELFKGYRQNDRLRSSFNDLAFQTFGLQFEDWYQNGFWGEQYNPYSIVEDGKVIANVSVNQTDFIWNGSRKHFIQLGTIMTDVSYRNQGLIRMLMCEIEKDHAGADGMYLFANDSVLGFYPRFGFRKAGEYQCVKRTGGGEECTGGMIQIPMRDKKAWDVLENAIRNSAPYSRFELVDNSALLLFYVTGFLQDNVYYDRDTDTYVIAERQGDELLIHNVFCERPVDLDRIINAFGGGISQVTLGFTPLEPEGYTVTELREEDTTLFVKGAGFDGFEESRIMIPTLAHA